MGRLEKSTQQLASTRYRTDSGCSFRSNYLNYMMKTKEEYIRQIAAMIGNRKAWQAANPDREALIRFNIPDDIGVIATISDAIEKGLVIANDAGRDLINALWEQGGNDEPTITMVRLAIELEHEPNRTAS